MNKFPFVKCPYCFRTLLYNDAVFRSQSGEKKVDEYLKSYHMENGDWAYSSLEFAVVDPAMLMAEQIEIDENGYMIGVENPNKAIRQPLQERLCPYCHNSLLKSFGKKDVKYIAVVGVPNSGKTTFLAAVNDSLRSKSWNWGSLDSEKTKPLDVVTDLYSGNRSEARMATKSIQGPYFYRIHSDANEFDLQENHVVFFDVPGEFYTSAEKINNNLASYISQADGIIFIVNAAEELEHQEAIATGYVEKIVRINDILDAFQQVGIMSNKKTAIVFNKLDKIKNELRITDLDSYHPHPTNNVVDIEYINNQSTRIVNLMLGEGGNSQSPLQRKLSKYMSRISQVFGPDSRVFATRLLVESKNEYYFRSEGAETPFLWLLSEVDAFPKTK